MYKGILFEFQISLCSFKKYALQHKCTIKMNNYE